MIKELTTTLFQVQDYCDKTQLLAKGIAYYCGILYYRLDWLHEDIQKIVYHPFQQKLLREILLVIKTLSMEQVEEYTWNYISLLLHDMFPSVELQAIEAEIRNNIHTLLPTLTPCSRMAFEIQYWGERETTDEKDEELNEIQAEISKLINT
jgi:hypothetical protein